MGPAAGEASVRNYIRMICCQRCMSFRDDTVHILKSYPDMQDPSRLAKLLTVSLHIAR